MKSSLFLKALFFCSAPRSIVPKRTMVCEKGHLVHGECCTLHNGSQFSSALLRLSGQRASMWSSARWQTAWMWWQPWSATGPGMARPARRSPLLTVADSNTFIWLAFYFHHQTIPSVARRAPLHPPSAWNVLYSSCFRCSSLGSMFSLPLPSPSGLQSSVYDRDIKAKQQQKRKERYLTRDTASLQ